MAERDSRQFAGQETFLLEGVSNHTHQDICRRWRDYDGEYDEALVQKVTLCLKFGVSLVAYGLPTIDAEQTVRELCAALGLPTPGVCCTRSFFIVSVSHCAFLSLCLAHTVPFSHYAWLSLCLSVTALHLSHTVADVSHCGCCISHYG